MALSKDGLYKRIEFHLKWVIALITLLAGLLAGLNNFFIELDQLGDALPLDTQNQMVQEQEDDLATGGESLGNYDDDWLLEPVEMVDEKASSLEEQITIVPNSDLELTFNKGKFEKIDSLGVIELGYLGLRLEYSVKSNENEKVLIYKFVNSTDLFIRIISLPVMCSEKINELSSSLGSWDIENVFIPANGNDVGKVTCSKGSTFSILNPS